MFDLIIKKTNQTHRVALQQAVENYQSADYGQGATAMSPSMRRVAIIVSVKNILLYFPLLMLTKRPCIIYYTGMGRLYLFGGKWLIIMTAYLLDRFCAVGFIVENQENKAILENIVRQPVYQISGSGLHVDGFKPAKKPAKQPTSSVQNKSVTLGYISRFHASKYTNLMIELAENLPKNVTLLIAGKNVGRQSYQKKFENLSAQNPNIRYLGYLNDSHKISDFYHQLDWLLYPSMREGLPLTLLESVWHQVPFITTPVCGCEELAELFDCPAIAPQDFVGFIRQGKYLQHPLDMRDWQMNIQPFYSDNVRDEFQQILQMVAQHPRLQR